MKSESSSRAKSGMGGKSKSSSKKSGKKPHSMHIKRGKSGGFIVTHHHLPDETGAMAEPEDHVVPDMDSLQSHVQDGMGDQGPAPMPQQAQAASAAAAPAPQPGM